MVYICTHATSLLVGAYVNCLMSHLTSHLTSHVSDTIKLMFVIQFNVLVVLVFAISSAYISIFTCTQLCIPKGKHWGILKIRSKYSLYSFVSNYMYNLFTSVYKQEAQI